MEAQARIMRSVRALIAEQPQVPPLFVGRCAVGTVLKCALVGWAISRKEDPLVGGGNQFGFSVIPDASSQVSVPLEEPAPA